MTFPYSADQTELNTLYSNVNGALSKLTPPTGLHPRYIVPLQDADANNGQAVLIGLSYPYIGSAAYNFTVNRCHKTLAAMKASGFDATLITIFWPTLDLLAPGADPQVVNAYRSLYTTICADAKSQGFYLCLSSGVSPVGLVPYDNAHYSSIDDVFNGKFRQAWWMDSNLHPDVLVSGVEAGTDKRILSGIADCATKFNCQYWHDQLNAFVAGRPGGSTAIYCGGSTPDSGGDGLNGTYKTYTAAAIGSNVQGFDYHPFPLLNYGLSSAGKADFWQILIKDYQAAHAAGKLLLTTQTSPYVISGQDTYPGTVRPPGSGNPSTRVGADEAYARECVAEFQPQVLAWMDMWQNIILTLGLVAGCNFWGQRSQWGGTLPYDPLYDNTIYKSTAPGYTGKNWQTFARMIDKLVHPNMDGPNTLTPVGVKWAGFAAAARGGPGLPPTVTGLAASDTTPVNGQTVTLTWTATGATAVVLTPGNINVLGLSSYNVIAPSNATTRYTITATNAYGTGAQHVDLVSSAPVAVPTVSLSASSTSPVYGDAITLSWTSAHATTLVLTPGSITVTGSTTYVLTPPLGATTYTLTATNSAGSASSSVTVTASAPPLPTITLAVSSTTAVVGQLVTLTWATTGAVSLSLSPGPIDVTGLTSYDVAPPLGSTVYTVTATNTTGSRSASVTVVGTAPIVVPVISFFAGDQSAIIVGAICNLSWIVVGATSVSLDNGLGVQTGTTAAVSPSVTTTYTLTATNAAGSVTATFAVVVTTAPSPPPAPVPVPAAPAAVGVNVDLALWISSAVGLRQALLHPMALRYQRTLNGIGSLNVALPYDANVLRLLVTDARLEVWRAINGGQPYLDMDTVWLLRFVAVRRDVNATRYIEVGAVSANELLLRRVVAYPAASAQAVKVALADDLMKAFVRDNFTAPVDGTRVMPQFVCLADTSRSALTVTSSVPWRTVLGVLQDIGKQTDLNGQALWFDVVGGYGGRAFTFQTFPVVRGVDHSGLGINPVVFSVEWASLASVVRATEASHEATAVYAVGQGIAAHQQSVLATDGIRVSVSPFNRREVVKSAPASATTGALTLDAQAALQAGVPKKQVITSVVSTPQALYGKHWKWGDLVSAQVEQETLRCRVLMVSVHWQNGQEDIHATLQAL